MHPVSQRYKLYGGRQAHYPRWVEGMEGEYSPSGASSQQLPRGHNLEGNHSDNLTLSLSSEWEEREEREEREARE